MKIPSQENRAKHGAHIIKHKHATYDLVAMVT